MANQPRDADGRFAERDREQRIAREHGALVAGLLGRKGAPPTHAPKPLSPSPRLAPSESQLRAAHTLRQMDFDRLIPPPEDD